MNWTGSFLVNGSEPLSGVLTITSDVVYLATLGPRPDRGWSFRDQAGHFHAYSTGEDRYPTLHEVDHTCDSPHLDGDAWWCECFTSWECRICKEVVKPRMVAGPHQEARPGLMSWDVSLDVESFTVPAWEVGAMVTVQAVFPRPAATRFGIAVVSSMAVRSFGDQINTKALLVGAGPLGERGTR